MYPVPETVDPGSMNRQQPREMGVSIQQQAMMTFMAAMLGNSQYAAFSHDEIAVKAHDAAYAYCSRMNQ